MKKYFKALYRMNNAVDAATSSFCWGKKPNKRYSGVAGKGGSTTNFEIKDGDRKES
jgi:hypothetical protein